MLGTRLEFRRFAQKKGTRVIVIRQLRNLTGPRGDNRIIRSGQAPFWLSDRMYRNESSSGSRDALIDTLACRRRRCETTRAQRQGAKVSKAISILAAKSVE